MVKKKIKTKLSDKLSQKTISQILPAHHFMRQQDSAHFRILVLTLVDDRLLAKTTTTKSVREIKRGGKRGRANCPTPAAAHTQTEQVNDNE